MDSTDQKILTLLRRNGRSSISDLATELGLSRATVRSRIEKMEQAEDIAGYTVLLRADRAALPVRGFTLVEVEGRAAEKISDSLGGFPEISAIHTTNGKWDLVIEFGTESLSGLDAMLWRLRLIPGVLASETSLLLASKHRPGGGGQFPLHPPEPSAI